MLATPYCILCTLLKGKSSTNTTLKQCYPCTHLLQPLYTLSARTIAVQLRTYIITIGYCCWHSFYLATIFLQVMFVSAIRQRIPTSLKKKSGKAKAAWRKISIGSFSYSSFCHDQRLQPSQADPHACHPSIPILLPLAVSASHP